MTQKIVILILLSVACIVQSYSVETLENGIDLRLHPGENCYRQCKQGQTKICYFKFVMEHYQAMGVACGKCSEGVLEDCFHPHCISVDGFERGVTSINRQIPSPPIHVCHNDKIVVDVVNSMAGSSASLHWHGLHMRNTQMYDGVPYVTQCPINYGQTFRYQFKASESGTQFYHSHAGHHKINGQFGSMVIRRGDKEPHRQLYDFDIKEHTMIVSDWVHDYAEMFVPGLPSRAPGMNPENILINGKGIYPEFNTKSPIEVFKVAKNKKYRFRFINSASFSCPVQVQMESHSLDIIASDSYDTQPVTVDTLIATGGERYDFIINANQDFGSYCLKLQLVGACKASKIEQFAILQYSKDENHTVTLEDYKNARDLVEKCRETTFKEENFMNHPNTTCFDEDHNSHCAADLVSLDVDEKLLREKVDERYYLSFNNYFVSPDELFEEGRYEHFLNPASNLLFQSGMNNISFAWPTFSLMTQPKEIDENMFCDENRQPKSCEDRTLCHCIHRKKIPLNSVVEFVLIDENRVISTMSHPFHMHGYGLTLTQMGQFREKLTVELFKELEASGEIATKVGKTAAIKDTIAIPSAGYAVFRIRADNPGFWLIHCHIDHHFATGMAMLLQVGKTKHFPKVPKNFPECNNFLPNVKNLD
ncbi:uncharacterized protein LOC134830148 [Culicoides brevitarsis]|uniref:uncharacterized protein LOC134830148 n=1 Tax=Culicoides brevitarsis TaxID=469753 RepID=UPI00307B2AF0